METTNKETDSSFLGGNDDFFLDSLMAVLDGMRRSEVLVDMTLKCSDGIELPAHRLVVSVVSPHFQRILSHETSSKITIVLPTFITSKCTKTILDFIYSGQLNLPNDIYEIKQLISAAHAIELQDFDEYFTASIVASLTTENFRDFWDLAEEIKNVNLEKAIRNFLRKDFTCFSQHSDFCQLSLDRLKKLLFDDSQQKAPEGVIISTVFAWVHAGPSARLEEFENELLPKLNFNCLTKEHLQRLLREEQLVCESRDLWLAIARILCDKGIPVQGYRNNEEEAIAPTALEKKIRNSESPVKSCWSCYSDWSKSPPGDLRSLAGKSRSSSSDTRHEDRGAHRFRSLSRSPKKNSQKCLSLEYDGSPDQEPVILVMGRKRNGDAAIQCFRLCNNVWAAAVEVEDCLAENAAWATHGYNLYLAGGMDARHRVLDSVYMYNIRTRQFTKMAHMRIARHAARAATLGWHVYVVGGLGNHDRSLSQVERYDVFSDEWEGVQPLPYEAWEVGVTVTERHLLVLGGRTQKEHKSFQGVDKGLAIHSYDPEVDQWTMLGILPEEFSCSYPVTTYTERTVYMVRHYNPTTMWAFELGTRKWLRSFDKNIPGPRRVMTILPFKDRLWIIYYGGKIVLYNLTTQNWDREAPFSRTIAIPMYAAIVHYPVEDQMFVRNTSASDSP